METFQLWEGKERGRTVRRLVRAEPIAGGDAETNARLLFKLDVVNLRHVCDVEISVKEGEPPIDGFGLCWLQVDFASKQASQ